MCTIRCILPTRSGSTALADNTYQVGIWSYIEAGLSITAASLATLRPFGGFLRYRSSTSRRNYHYSGFFPLSRDLVHERCSFPSKNRIHEDEYQLWSGGGFENHHDVTTVALVTRLPAVRKFLAQQTPPVELKYDDVPQWCKHPQSQQQLGNGNSTSPAIQSWTSYRTIGRLFTTIIIGQEQFNRSGFYP